MKLSKAIAQLETWREKLINGRRAFFAGLRSEYIQLATDIALTIFSSNRPPMRAAEDWLPAVTAVASTVSAQVLSVDGVGLLLFLRGRRGDEQLELEELLQGKFTERQVADYVRAGIEGDPLGKQDISEEDLARTPEHVAFVILRAIAQGTASAQRIRDIAAFIEADVARDIEALYPAVRAAWAAFFAVRLWDDVVKFARFKLTA